MRISRTLFYKIVTGFLSFIIVIGASYGPLSLKEIPRAHAVLGVGDIVVDPTNLVQNTVSAAADVDSLVVSKILNGLAWSVAKLTIQSITRSTVNWINSGFNGSPAFVSDLQSNLKYLGDSVAEDFFKQLNTATVGATGFNIKSPFQDQINQKLRAEYYKQTSGALGLSAYDLSGHSANPTAFIQQGNFSQGGFNAFFSASQNPANNPFGAYKLASDQLWASIDAATQQRKSELDWGKGFLPWRGACASSASASNSSVSLSKTETCTKNAVRTPGSVIESQLENSLGTGIRQLELADSINEVVGALMGQLVNQVLGSGGLLGASQPSSGGGASYITQATNPSQLSTATASLADGVIQNIATERSAIVAYQQSWQTILDAANKAQEACGVGPEISSAITLATANVSKGGTALTQTDALNSKVQAANQLTTSDKSTAIASAVSDYQTYLTSPTIPGVDDQSDAIIESTDSGDTKPPSLYTRMTTLAKGCKAK